MTIRKHKQGKHEQVPSQEQSSPGETIPIQLEEEITAVEEVAEEDVACIQRELEETRTKAAEYLDGWQRSMAEFANYKKRVDRDREQVQQNITGTTVKRYLEVVDDIERALKTRPQENEGAAWANGIELIYRKLLTILESQDVKPMDVLGHLFDPNRHEAIGQMESEVYPSGHIVEVVQNGYLIGERVLRPAIVRIAN